MRPKKAAQKAPPKTRTTIKAKPAAKSKPAPLPATPKPSKRRRAASRPPPAIPEWDKGVATLSARERKRFKLSRISSQEEIDEDYIAHQASLLMSESRTSWGVTQQSPITGSRRSRPQARGLVRGRHNDVENAYKEMLTSMNPKKQRLAVANCPSRTPILRVPLEIRERIYEYLLIYPTPIMVKSDWMVPERNQFVSHSVVLVCKRFAVEASSFLYRRNTFQSLIREPSSTRPLRFEAPPSIPAAFHALFRNIVIDCSKNCWSLDWHEEAAEGLKTLVRAKPVIDTLTLVVVPQRVGMSDTALGRVAKPVTFADFLWYPGPFMEAVRMLSPKTFEIVIKKPGKRRLGMVIDLSYLRIGTAENNLTAIVNRETLRLRSARIRSLAGDLEGLKERFEDVYEDDERALGEGLCYLIDAGIVRRDEDGMEGGASVGEGNTGGGDGDAERDNWERS